MELDYKAKIFEELHLSGPGFIMPNAWDCGSAIILAQEGFKAIATTSAGIAFSLGKPDYYLPTASQAVSREEMFARIRQIVNAVELPVNGDLEAGYGDRPEAVAETIRLAIDAGLAGGNIEDKRPSAPGLYDERLAVERISAARETIDAAGAAFVLTARTDALLDSAPDALNASIRRCNMYRQAGADCLYLTGISKLEDIKLAVREIDGPLNVVMGLGSAHGNAYSMLEAGVQRISLGASIARTTLGVIRKAAQEVFAHGTVSYAADQIPQTFLSDLFSRSRTSRA